MAFKRLVLATNYQGKEYNFDIDSKDVNVHLRDTADNKWQYWATIDDFTFEIVGRVSIGGYPLPEGLYVYIYPKKSEYIQRIAGQIPTICKLEINEEDFIWKTKRFKDLKVGDTIYVTDRWDFYKLTIAGIVFEGDNENGVYNMKLTFLDDCEFARCDNALNIDSCFQIDKGYLEDFCIESYRDCIFFADKEECRDYLKALQERAGDAIERINKSHYAWEYIDEYGKMTQSKSFETMGECYRDMHKNVLLKLDSLTCGMEKMWYEIKFETDNITINDNNNEQRWDWCIVEVV